MIKILSLTKKFGDLHVIEDFNYEFHENKVTCLFGPSGCGKTTLLNILSGVIEDYEGENEFLNRKLSYVFQEDRLIPWKTVVENIEFVLDERSNGNEAMDYLKMVGLENCIESYPDELSGGMNRRVALARGLAYSTDLLIMDEPFKGLDDILKFNIIKSFQAKWRENSSTVIIVTHDIEEAKLYSDHIVYLGGLPLEVIKVENNEREID